MKKILLTFLFGFMAVIAVFSQIQLFEPINLSNEYGPSREQSLAADGNSLYLAWNQWGDIMFRRSENDGLNWGNKLTLYSGIDYGANYPVVAASQGKVFIAYYRNTSGNSQIFMVRSTNNGQTFGNEIQVTNAIRGALVPQIAASGDTVVIAYEDRDIGYKYQIFVTVSTNAGQTWSAPMQITNTTAGARWCNIALKNQSLYVLWNDQTGSSYNHLDLFFRKSDNFGQSWSAPLNISNNQAYNARLKTKVIDNSLYVVVSANQDGLQSDIMLYRSHNLGDSWESPLNLSDNTGASSRPDVWVERNSPGNHRIYTVWSDDTYSADDRAFLKYSIDHGFSWSDLIQFSQNTEDAAWPAVVARNDGAKDNLYFAYYRPNDGTFNYEVWGRRAENTLASVVTLSGTVTDNNGQPIAGATVSLSGYLTFTMENGQYSAEVPAGNYHFSVLAAGFQSYVNPNLNLQQNTTLDISLVPIVPGNYPPHLLNAQINNANSIHLSWDQPIGFNSKELSYDDGEANGLFWTGSATGNEFMAVAFQHAEPMVLRQLKVFASAGSPNEQMLLYVVADQGGQPDGSVILGGPYLVDIESGWTKASVDIPVPANARFYIACQWNNGNTYKIGGDLNVPDGFSYSTNNGGVTWYIHDEMDFMIRAGIADEGKSIRELSSVSDNASLIGYNTYLNGNQVGETSPDLNANIHDVAIGETHTVGVSAVYDSGESPQANLEITVPEPLLFPPLNLEGELLAWNNLALSWDAPATEGEWIHWDDGENSDAVGGANIPMFDAAVRFTTDDLTAFHGQYLTKIAAFIATGDCQIFLRVWQGGNQYFAGNLIREQLIAYPLFNAWNTIELETPVQIDASQELWFGYRIINTGGGFPAGTDNGPAIAFKGDMLLYGSSWISMYSQFGWNINWNIQGFVVDAGNKTTEIPLMSKLEEKPVSENTGPPERIKNNAGFAVFNRNYSHFNIYRNNEIIGNVPADTFVFNEDPSESGGGTYYVTSAWGDFESAPSNTVIIIIDDLENHSEEGHHFSLYPNPAKLEALNIQLDLTSEQNISVKLTDASGREFHLLENKIMETGTHRFSVSALVNQQLKSGVYLLQVSTSEKLFTKRLILIE
ncbi:MAG: carboxypeptidase regulatory-like domain-containing protein [Bacteroidetes bacterium]|nr:carboxypeptidase regulatory-like domain-containing protein [Bacteroidota bacterium]